MLLPSFLDYVFNVRDLKFVFVDHRIGLVVAEQSNRLALFDRIMVTSPYTGTEIPLSSLYSIPEKLDDSRLWC